MSSIRQDRPGLTLVEIVVAILLFGLAALGLAAGSAAILRQMSASNLRARAVSLAREKAESAHSLPCGAFGGGDETRSGVRDRWTVSVSSAITVDQQLERSDALGRHADRFLSAAACD